MNERTDFELLRDFARHGDQTAFTSAVRRHLDLVYATARRKVEDDGAAQEITQNVFAALAHKAWQFAADDSVPAWLYQTTLLEARGWWRGELRRRRREQTAAELGTTMKTPDEQPALRALVPLLDDALLSLREKDRTALLLRYYETRSLRDVGASLGVGEDAAQKRVAGALEKVARFFQRRGFKTGTAAAVAAALQHTAASAPALVAVSVTQAAAQMAPPALVGWLAVAARFASLTQVQAVAVCVVVAAVPAAWQWNEHQQAAETAGRYRAQLAATQTEYAAVRTETERLRATSIRAESSLATAADAAAQSASAAQRFADWKNRMRAQLMAANYRWPEDSPFVRIPKIAARQIEVHEPVAPPGMLRQEARELLGLTPEERQQIEDALHQHFTALDHLIDAKIYETNQVTPGSASFAIPSSSLASQVWAVPALGPEVGVLAGGLQQTLRTTLGEERWPLVQRQLDTSGSDSLGRILNLDAGESGQNVAAWIDEKDGKLLVGFGWLGNQAAYSSGGIALSLFLPGSPTMVMANMNNLPDAISRPMMDWIHQQAAQRLGNGAAL